MRINKIIQNTALAAVISSAPIVSLPLYAQKSGKDAFIKTEIPVHGTSEESILMDAPDPTIDIDGEEHLAKIVVDINTNTLYKYTDGVPEAAYKIASGSQRTPTHKGVRIVTHIERYPFSGAPRWSKRRRNPSAYGPKIICLNKVNPNTGEQSSTGEFIHGTNNPTSLGKYISHGCMRMDNDVILSLCEEVKSGDIVIIQ